MQSPDPTSLLVVLAIAALAPVFATASDRVRLPIVVVEIILGIVVGPQVLGLAETDQLIEVLSQFGLAFLFFLAGLEIDLDRIRGRPAALAARAWGSSLVIALTIAVVLWQTGAIGGPLLVALALATTALGALVPILKDAGLAPTPVGTHTLATGAAGEFGPVVALSIVLAFASGDPWRTLLLLVFGAIAIAGGVLASKARPPRLVRLIRTTMHTSGQLALRLAIVLLFGFVALANEFGLDVVLGAFAAGLILGVVVGGEEEEIFRAKLEGVGYGFLIPIFFIATGLEFDLDALGEATAIILVPVCALVFLVVRGAPTWFAYRRELGNDERGALALMSAAALPLVVAITTIATERGIIDSTEAAALVGAGMLSLLAYPLLALALVRTRARGSVEPENP